jgi:hypothetical protein
MGKDQSEGKNARSGGLSRLLVFNIKDLAFWLPLV